MQKLQEHCAVIDIGSNSLRLMEGWQKDGQWQFGPKKLVTTRLGQHTGEQKQLAEDSMERSFAVLAEWKQQLGNTPVCAVATSAVREAANGQAFMTQVRQRFGWQAWIIAGEVEAALSFCGAASAVSPEKIAAVIDIGGGSTEVALGRKGEVQWSHSYPVGALRPQGSVGQWLAMPAQPQVLIGVGGTMTSLAAMEQELDPYDPEKVNGYVISQEQLTARIAAISELSLEERRHIKGLQPRRSDIILGGLQIAQSFMRHYEISSVQISERDLMEGLFLRQSFHNVPYFV